MNTTRIAHLVDSAYRDGYGRSHLDVRFCIVQCDTCGIVLNSGHHYTDDNRHHAEVLARVHTDAVHGPLTAAREELAALGITDEQMDTVTGFGLRRIDRCLADDTIVNKYAAGALTRHGVMMVLFGSNSPQHLAGRAL